MYQYLYKDMEYILPKVTLVGEQKPTLGWNIPKTLTVAHSFTCVLSGEAYYDINGKVYTLKQNDIIYITPNVYRTVYSNPDNPPHIMAIHFICLKNGKEITSLGCPTTVNMPFWKDFIDILRRAYTCFMQRESGYSLLLSAITIQALYTYVALLSKSDAPRNPRLESVINYIYNNIERQIKTEEIAKRLSLSTVYFCAWFKKETGRSPKQYILETRISHATLLLSSGKENISSVAYKCGFADVYHFSHAFKKYTGIPPSKYLH